MSIPGLDVAAALVKMTTYDYKLGNGYFIKVLISKRYTLPTMVLEALIDYFCKIGMGSDKDIDEAEDEENMDENMREMPVMWHQTLLALVQCYKTYFTPRQRKKLNTLIKIQNHHAITPEIRREFASMPRSVNQENVMQD